MCVRMTASEQKQRRITDGNGTARAEGFARPETAVQEKNHNIPTERQGEGTSGFPPPQRAGCTAEADRAIPTAAFR